MKIKNDIQIFKKKSSVIQNKKKSKEKNPKIRSHLRNTAVKLEKD